jgi:hypothetical protein
MHYDDLSMSRRIPPLRRSLDAMSAAPHVSPEGGLRSYASACSALPATAPARGVLLRYEQWNIDPASVVSFAALAFGRGEAPPPGEGGA